MITNDNYRWISFKEKFPKPECGVLIKIDVEDDPYGAYLPRLDNILFYGYTNDGDGIFVTNDLTNNASMSWTITSDYELADMYWHYDSLFDPDNDLS